MSEGDGNFKVSPHFSFHELTRTDKAGFQEANRMIAPGLLVPANALAWGILEGVRRRFDMPLIVHSAYRCEELNQAVGSSDTSQHIRFEACDFHIAGGDTKETWKWIWKQSMLPFGQLIFEAVGNASWIHISLGHPFRSLDRSGQVMTYDGREYTHVERAWVD